ncbi:MAG: DNA topoisomerase IV subunit A [Lactobacillaceae bacterium]|jgi:topoisomerase-4 subunit A|nr:DNA topoisomerase IV subunit A [Lactobacillaceae bacterium]
MAKKEEPKTGIIQELSLEAVMGDRFGRYSKYIIQDRALPDIRDGLKPVQRRILFAMNQDGNTYDKQFRKSAKSVGNVMGNYHPHGDSSIYEAMVRMSQDWKLRAPLIEMHGNNGSMDNDPAAAMRYTEARLSKLAGEMLRDLDKDTVEMVLNFDDTANEPTVLPGHFPNLLVNGATGISAGYATNIPPHNLGEVIDASIYLLAHKNATVEDLMEFVPGPDFPTGAIIQGADGIKQAYREGKGRIIVRSRTEIVAVKGGKSQIIISEIPYEVNKAELVRKMDEIRANKDVAGLTEVRDETDRDGLQIVLELSKDANADGILQYLFKKTELQISYNFNMVAIHNQRPELIGLVTALQAFLDHQEDIITKRTAYDLKKAQDRQHIVTGLIKALSILDAVIAAIRASNDRKDAKQNLIDKFEFTEAQAEAIVTLQLYRLSNTDVTQLQAEFENLTAKIAEFTEILTDPKALKKVLKAELVAIKKEYSTPRLSSIQDEVEEIKIDRTVTVADEDVVLLVSRSGYVKRASLRSFSASGAENGLRDDDEVVFEQKVNTLQHVFIFTNLGNVIYRPIHELPDFKWKDAGEHLSQSITEITADEVVLRVEVASDVNQLPGEWLIATNDGYIKRTAFADLAPRSNYKKKAAPFIKLKDADSQVVGLHWIDEANMAFDNIFLASQNAQGLRYGLNEVPTTGARTAGVKSMNLAVGDRVVSAELLKDEDTITIISNRGAFKRMPASEVPVTSRAKKGVAIMRELKSDPHRIVGAVVVAKVEPSPVTVITANGKTFDLITTDHPMGQRYSNGSFVIDVDTAGEPVRMHKFVTPLVLV